MLIGWGLGAVVSLVLLLPPALGVIDGQILMLEHVRSSAIAPLGIMMDVMSQLTRKFGPELNRDTVGNVQKAGFRLAADRKRPSRYREDERGGEGRRPEGGRRPGGRSLGRADRADDRVERHDQIRRFFPRAGADPLDRSAAPSRPCLGDAASSQSATRRGDLRFSKQFRFSFDSGVVTLTFRSFLTAELLDFESGERFKALQTDH